MLTSGFDGRLISFICPGRSPKERGHTYTPDNGGADRLVAEEMKQSKSVGMLEGELGA
jgi:hypothetical protein